MSQKRENQVSTAAVQDLSERRSEAPRERKDSFPPFEMTLFCPRCNRPLPLMISSVHLEVSIHCPRCNRPLTTLIRREIKNRIKGK